MGDHEQGPEYKVFVGGISWQMDDAALLKEFEDHGATKAEIMMDKMTNRSRGFGFVWFQSRAGMEDAIRAKHNAELDGRRISVKEAIPQDQIPPEQRGRDRYRAASRYGDSSDSRGYERGGYERGGYGGYDSRGYDRGGYGGYGAAAAGGGYGWVQQSPGSGSYHSSYYGDSAGQQAPAAAAGAAPAGGAAPSAAPANDYYRDPYYGGGYDSRGYGGYDSRGYGGGGYGAAAYDARGYGGGGAGGSGGYGPDRGSARGYGSAPPRSEPYRR